MLLNACALSEQVVEIGAAWFDSLVESGLWAQGDYGEWGRAGVDSGYEDVAGESGGVGEE